MRSLIERVKLAGMEDGFGEILVPTEEVVEMRNGQKRKSERKFFPGYVLVQMDMNEGTWHLVKDTPRVMGFIGGTADKPAPITDNTRIVIIEADKQVVGILVDSVAEVVYLRQSEIETAPNVGTDESAKFIQGVCNKNNELLILVDLEKMMTEDEWAELSGF